jgi:hypothetical protein
MVLGITRLLIMFQNVKNKPYSHKVTMAEHKTEQSAECLTYRININLLWIWLALPTINLYNWAIYYKIANYKKF